MDEIKIEKTNKGICLGIPLKSQGKFRCKNRTNSSEYGEGFAPKTEAFTNDSYVEWQIGYDARVDDVNAGKKSTTLTEWVFIGANGAKKYLYELSEIVWELCEKKLISKKQIESLIAEVDSFTMFLQENFQIQMKSTGAEKFNGKVATRHEIKLPTFTFDNEEENEIFTEISIQKQQYATGVQPMLYVIIPATAFDNADEIIGHNSSKIPYGFYTIATKEKANNFLKIFSNFGLCSERHKQDVLEILKIIHDNVN